MILGISCLIFTLPCSATAIYDLATGAPNASGAFGALMMMTMLSGIAVFAIYRASTSPEISSHNIPPKTVGHPQTVTRSRTTGFEIDEKTEGKILQMANRHNGRLTATHLAMDSPLTIEQATQILSDFERRGIVYSAVTTHGGTEYVFPDLLPAKAQSDVHNDLDEFDNQILDFERSKQAAKEHAELFKSTHKN